MLMIILFNTSVAGEVLNLCQLFNVLIVNYL